MAQVMAAFVPESDYTGASRDEWLAAPAAPAAMEGVIKLRGLPFTATKQVRNGGTTRPSAWLRLLRPCSQTHRSLSPNANARATRDP